MAQQPSPCRCPWVDLAKADYVAYHDQEWGVPIHDDRRLFEFLVLESAQAGVSWYTVLRKRDNYCRAFADFDPERVAQYTDSHIATLLQNPGIIRNRQKILAAITNAQRFLDVQAAFGSFAAYIWRFVDHTPMVHTLRSLQEYPATSPESDALSQDLRQRTVCCVLSSGTSSPLPGRQCRMSCPWQRLLVLQRLYLNASCFPRES